MRIFKPIPHIAVILLLLLMRTPSTHRFPFQALQCILEIRYGRLLIRTLDKDNKTIIICHNFTDSCSLFHLNFQLILVRGHRLQLITDRTLFYALLQFHHFTLQSQLLHFEIFYSIVVVSDRVLQVNYLQEHTIRGHDSLLQQPPRTLPIYSSQRSLPCALSSAAPDSPLSSPLLLLIPPTVDHYC